MVNNGADTVPLLMVRWYVQVRDSLVFLFSTLRSMIISKLDGANGQLNTPAFHSHLLLKCPYVLISYPGSSS